uniref:Succinate dehydrogenase cytochrome subunit 4 n=1 Tax=Ginkgo biloba TaxID=3311 RepID=A0A8F4MEH1_GINBI|nr:succinate dehydrogenase cytochrome subunit 4 [Ginkgo biloba]
MVPAFRRRGSVIPICPYLLVGRSMKGRTSGLRNESSETKRTGLFRRITAASPPPLIIISKVSSTSPPNIYLFRHIDVGIGEITADHVHQEMTRNWILIYPGSFLLIVIKDAFLSFAYFPNKWNNPMDRTNP